MLWNAVLPAPVTRPAALPHVVGATPAGRQPMLPLPAALSTLSSPTLAPDDERAVQALCLALVEALSGRRPATQLRGAMTLGAFRLVADLAQTGQTAGMRLASVRLQCPDAGAVEASVRLGTAGQSRAAAVRLEWRDGRWACVALELALTDGVRRWPRGSA